MIMKIVLLVILTVVMAFFGCSDEATDVTGEPSEPDQDTTKAVINDTMDIAKSGQVALGSDPGESAAEDDEIPKHNVTLAAFDISKYEVTCFEFAKVMNWALAENNSVTPVIIDSTFDLKIFKNVTITDSGSTSDTTYSDSVVYYKTTRKKYRLIDVILEDNLIFYRRANDTLLLFSLDPDYISAKPKYRVEPEIDSINICTVKTNTENCTLIKVSTDITFLTDIVFTPVDNKKNYPITNISWHGAALFCNLKSEKEGFAKCYDESVFDVDTSKKGYRLPTEAEWEYAARGGLAHGDSRFPSGSDISEFDANFMISGMLTYLRQVGNESNSRPNGFGLYDMAGNVWEWCTDFYDPAYYNTLTGTPNNPVNLSSDSLRVLRGGSYMDDADEQRCANRSSAAPTVIDSLIGFRIVKRK
jgi:formylglycine-generating enzyme required for sulfatase activity